MGTGVEGDAAGEDVVFMVTRGPGERELHPHSEPRLSLSHVM